MQTIYLKDYSSIHSLCHISIGMLSCKFPFLWYIIILPYQLLQYILDCRFFINKWKILKKNSIYHTIYKLSEYLLGMLTSFCILILKYIIGI